MRFLLLMFLLVSFHAAAQTEIPFNSPRWKIQADEAVQGTYLGQPSIMLKNGKALLEDADFRDGIIEFDMALSKARYFPGIGFRMKDSLNYEEYYLRPHQSGNPDAMQYTPVYNGSAGWQLYHGAGFTNAKILPFDRWLHIRILVSGSRAEVYFDQDTIPVLFMHSLKRDIASGMIVLSNLWPQPVWYSNFVYTRSDAVKLKSTSVPRIPLAAGEIVSWQVSNPFSEALLKDKLGLPSTSYAWRPLEADEAGITNFSRLYGVSENSNTVFAKTIINVDKAGIKKLTFGFSDRARVYLNGRLLYKGEDGFMSRDYRFLGTMGYYDVLYLDLKKGHNELWIAVSEDFGGWGVKAKVE